MGRRNDRRRFLLGANRLLSGRSTSPIGILFRRGAGIPARSFPFRDQHAGRRPRSLSGLLMNTISSSGNFIGMAGICLDRLLKQRSALRKPDFSFDFPPQRGGLRSLSGGAVCIAAETTSEFRTLSQSPTNSWRARVPALRFGPARNGKPFRYPRHALSPRLSPDLISACA